MQIGQAATLFPMSSAQVALRLLGAQTPSAPASPKAMLAHVQSDGAMAALLGYAKTAQGLAKPPAPAPYDPAAHLPDGWSMSGLVSVDTLDPAYRDFAAGLGATHVRLYGPDAISDAAFQARIAARLDEFHAGDPAYEATKSAGQIEIRRMSDVMAALGDTRAGTQSMALFRGEGGSEYFGSGGTGITSPAFNAWSDRQSAAGQYLSIGGTMGQDDVASRAAA